MIRTALRPEVNLSPANNLTFDMAFRSAWIMQEARRFAGELMTQLAVKFGYLSQLPWLFVNVEVQPVAGRILELWRKRPPQEHHRVTRYLMTRFHDDVVRISEGSPCPAPLRRWMEEYRTARLSEAEIEGYHSRVEKCAQTAHAVKLPFLFAKIRWQTNVERIREWTSSEGKMKILGREWSRWKRVVLVHVHSGRQGAKINLKHFVNLFYRLRPETFTDLSPLGSRWYSHVAPALSTISDVTKVKREFCEKVLPPGTFLTIPAADEHDGPNVFQVLKYFTGGEKRADHTELEDLRDLVAVQPYRVWEANRYEMQIYPAENPINVVLWSHTTSFEEFRRVSQKWTCSASDVEHCFELSDPRGLSDGIDVMADNCPIFLKVQHLRDNGWEPRPGLIHHVSDSKLFSIDALVHKPEYVNVLLHWGRCNRAMRSDNVRGFYACVLASLNVPERRRSAYYKRCLKENRVCPDIFGEPQRDDGIVQDNSEPRLALMDVHASDSDAVEADEELEALQDASESSSSSSSEKADDSSSSSSDQTAAAEAGGGENADASAPWPDTIDGATLKHEQWDGPYQKYERLHLVCKYHSHCARRREISTRHTELSSREPLAFLALWHRAGRDLPSREEHKRVRSPTRDALTTYLAENGGL